MKFKKIKDFPFNMGTIKTINGYPDYRITSKGTVYRLNSRNPLSISSHNGRYVVRLKNSNGKEYKNVATMMAKAFLGGTPKGYVIGHKDGNCKNNDVHNLYFKLKNVPKHNTICEHCGNKFVASTQFTRFCKDTKCANSRKNHVHLKYKSIVDIYKRQLEGMFKNTVDNRFFIEHCKQIHSNYNTDPIHVANFNFFCKLTNIINEKKSNFTSSAYWYISKKELRQCYQRLENQDREYAKNFFYNILQEGRYNIKSDFIKNL